MASDMRTKDLERQIFELRQQLSAERCREANATLRYQQLVIAVFRGLYILRSLYISENKNK